MGCKLWNISVLHCEFCHPNLHVLYRTELTGRQDILQPKEFITTLRCPKVYIGSRFTNFNHNCPHLLSRCILQHIVRKMPQNFVNVAQYSYITFISNSRFFGPLKQLGNLRRKNATHDCFKEIQNRNNSSRTAGGIYNLNFPVCFAQVKLLIKAQVLSDIPVYVFYLASC